MGIRIVDGEKWNWFCSVRCACRSQGLRCASEGRVHRYAAKLRDARLKQARDARHALYVEDVHSLQRYGVPEALTLAILDRAHSRGDRSGYNRCFAKYARRNKAAA